MSNLPTIGPNYENIEAVLEQAGELLVVLESGEEYELHTHDTRFEETRDDVIIESDGYIDGEYRVVSFPASRIEHHYIHKAL